MMFLYSTQQQLFNGRLSTASRWAGTRTQLTQCITFIVIKFQALPTFPPMVTGLPLGSDTKENLGETVKHAELEDKSPHFLYTDWILDLMRPLVYHWSPVTRASHCVTTSRPAVATQTRATVDPAIHPKVFLCQTPFLSQPSLFLSSSLWKIC